jgi:hypothetical protein
MASIMDNLFNHPGFRLIYVDDDMSLVTPLDHKEDILEKGYRCISHLWGQSPLKWENHPVKGVDWKVHVRQEKRERIMQIFNHHKGYFWMDVFCTDQSDINKPLDIMGDVYKNCTECICMFDIRKGEKYLGEYASEKNFLEKALESIENPTDINWWGANVCLRNFKAFKRQLADSSWSKRVWTWQEAVLPPKVSLCTEVSYTKEYGPMDRDIFVDMFTKLGGGSANYLVELGFTRGSTLDDMKLSSRECTNQEDYIYGIVGLLDIYIPPGLDAISAAKELQKELDKRGINVKIRVESYPWLDLGNLFVGIGRSFMDSVRQGYRETILEVAEHRRQVLAHSSYK